MSEKNEGLLKKRLAKERFDGSDIDAFPHSAICVVGYDEVLKILDEAFAEFPAHDQALKENVSYYGLVQKWKEKWGGAEK